jgi:hypothetical protein
MHHGSYGHLDDHTQCRALEFWQRDGNGDGANVNSQSISFLAQKA